jgi:hypothetical protein
VAHEVAPVLGLSEMGAATRRPVARGQAIAAGALLGTILAVTAAVTTDKAPTVVAAAGLAVVVIVMAHGALRRWDVLVAGVVVIAFVVPIKRYELPAALPFSLEPYRLVIAAVAALWTSSLLIDPRVRARASGLEGPLALFATAALVSVALNDHTITAVHLGPVVVKALTFFASFFVLFYVIVSLVRSREQLDAVIRMVVGAGAFVAFFALVEYRTHFNLFNHLQTVLPILHFNDPAAIGVNADSLSRAGEARVYGSAAHPIELSAVMVMLAPLGIYLFQRSGRRRWACAAILLVLAALATLSRTGVMMLFTTIAVYLWMRPVQVRRLWPYALPLIIAVYFALPNTLGSIYSGFFPREGLVSQQSERDPTNADQADGRLADIGPVLHEVRQDVLFGEGFGTRVTDLVSAEQLGVPRARIIDDQWLSSLQETGLVGVFAVLWLLARTIRRMRRIAREDDGADGWLAIAFAASVYGFAIGMLTFDSFGFVQVTIVLFVMLGLSSVLGRAREGAARPAAQGAAGA